MTLLPDKQLLENKLKQAISRAKSRLGETKTGDSIN